MRHNRLTAMQQKPPDALLESGGVLLFQHAARPVLVFAMAATDDAGQVVQLQVAYDLKALDELRRQLYEHRQRIAHRVKHG